MEVTETPIIFLMTIIATCLMAGLLLLVIPASEQRYLKASRAYFQGFFGCILVGCIVLLYWDQLPIAPAAFLNHGFFLASAYCVAFGIKSRNGEAISILRHPAFLHVVVYVCIQTAMAHYYPQKTSLRMAFAVANIIAVFFYCLSFVVQRRQLTTANRKLYLISLGVAIVSIMALPVLYMMADDLNLLYTVLLAMIQVLVVFVFGAYYTLFVSDLVLKYKKLVSIDELTGLYTRKHFFTQAQQFLTSALRHEFPVSIIFCDIDDFLTINAKYGHRVGDNVVVALADTIRNMTRSEDITCRFNGDEIVVLLPQTQIDSAAHLAERLRHAFNQVVLQDDSINEMVPLSASFGITSMDHYTDIEASLKAANDALQLAKQRGGNRVERDPQVPDHVA